ncbi:MAG: hypothetical protein PHI28_03420 [Mangrovibacterium sp.]|nr:hypothetical protein [Mangrovibacterium sp.]
MRSLNKKSNFVRYFARPTYYKPVKYAALLFTGKDRYEIVDLPVKFPH